MVYDNSYKDYLIQARKNDGLVVFLREECNQKYFFQWIFVVIYYTALHYFYAFCAYKGKAIPRRHKDYQGDDGVISLAINTFYTNTGNRISSVGGIFEQIFQWSVDVRYKPERGKLLNNQDLSVALKCLENVKFVTFNEIKNRVVMRGDRMSIVSLSEQELNYLYKKINNS